MRKLFRPSPLSRWGASENTFKHLKDRHPLHYHPGFNLVKSDQQMIVNPEIKEKERIINKVKKGLNKIYRQLTKAKKVLNKDGAPRQNSVKERLKKTILDQETKLETIKKEKRQLPEKVDVSTLEDYKSFKLTSLGARTPLGKCMIIEVDGAPT